MDLKSAVEAIEYKIATESDNFESGREIRMDITTSWPAAASLEDALRKKFPFVTLRYEERANDKMQLILENRR